MNPLRRPKLQKLSYGLFLGIALILIGATHAPSQPTCPRASPDFYPPLTDSPRLALYSREEFESRPPLCGALLKGPFNLFVTSRGTIKGPDEAALWTRLGAVSNLEGIRYWSISDQRWNTLITKAGALDHQENPRPDFSAEQLKNNRLFLFMQQDNRSSGDVIYKLEILENGPERIVAVVENISAVKYLLFPVFNAGDVRSVYIFENLGPREWGYYNLYGVREKWRHSKGEEKMSYIHRAVAMYRHFAYIPTDLNPPYSGPVTPH